MPTRLIRMRALMQIVQLSRTRIYELMREGRFPKCVKLSQRAIAWDAAEVEQWLADKFSRNAQQEKSAIHQNKPASPKASQPATPSSGSRRNTLDELTMRDHFASFALQGILASADLHGVVCGEAERRSMCRLAYEYALQMMAVRSLGK